MEEIHWLQMGVQGQLQGIRYTQQVQGTIGCKRVLSVRGHWLQEDLCSYNKDEHHPSSSSHCSIIWLEDPLDGWEEFLPQWSVQLITANRFLIKHKRYNGTHTLHRDVYPGNPNRENQQPI
jgi:hypothetical protein